VNPPKHVALLTAAIVAISEVATPRETNPAVPPPQPHDHKELLVDAPVIGSTASPISSSNNQRKYAVEKVQADPEIFWLLAIRHPEFRNGQFMKDFGNFDEGEMRTALHELGCIENECTFLIEKARRNWRAPA
jgi:hypothetical protein